jgi:hypothetical protein
MPAPVPSSLDSNALTLRLAELAGEEREVQVDFLLHLAEFEARRVYVELGFSSLWSYCLEVLHLREGAAGRRIGAMRVLVRFPNLEAPLRDGRLSLSTIVVLGSVLTGENVGALLARAAYRTKREIEEIVVSLKPRPAPAPGLRKLPARAPAGAPTVLALEIREAAPERSEPSAENRDRAPAIAANSAESPVPQAPAIERRRPTDLEAVAQDRWSLRAMVDRDFKQDLETLRCLLAHKIPDGDLTEVLREAIRCAVERHGKRRGAVPPSRKASRPAAPARKTHEPSAEVKREVWERDGGRCTYVAPDGRRCDCRFKLEYDHIAETKPATVANTRLRCRTHNVFHAEQTYGRAHMERFRRDGAAPAGAPRLTPPGPR